MKFRKKLNLESMVDNTEVDNNDSVGSVDDIILESSGPLSVEVIEGREMINKEIAADQETVNACDSVSEEIRLSEKILDSIDEAEEISEAHSKALELITEQFENKWGYKRRFLQAESFCKQDHTLTREGFIDFMKYMGTMIAVNVAAIAVVTSLVLAVIVSIDYIVNKLTTYRGQVDKLLRELNRREPSEVAIMVGERDNLPSKWGWIRKLHLGEEFIGGDYERLKSEIQKLGNSDSLFNILEKEVKDDNPAEVAGALYSAYKDDIVNGKLPMWGAKVANVSTEEIVGTEVIGSVTVTKTKVKSNEIRPPELTHAQLVEICKEITKVIDHYSEKKAKFKAFKEAAEAAQKTKGRPVTEDTDTSEGLTDDVAADLKRIYTSSGILVKEIYVNSLTDLIEGVIGYADASVNVKGIKMAYAYQ